MEGTRTSEFLRLIYSSIIQASRDIASNSCDIFPPFLSRYVKYGNLELYLHGLELGYLVPKFQVHVNTFNAAVPLALKETLQHTGKYKITEK